MAFDEYKGLVKLGKPKKTKREILVSDLMTREIIPVSPSDPLDKVAELFLDNNISGAPVLDKQFFIGEVSKTDILNLVKKHSLEDLSTEDKKKLSGIKVGEVMKKPICVYQDDPIKTAEDKMQRENISRLLVLDRENNLVGIITKTDLVMGKSKKEIKDHISTKIDEMLKILEKKKRRTFKELSDYLGIPEGLIENWSKILEDHGLVEIEYPPIGSPIVKIKTK